MSINTLLAGQYISDVVTVATIGHNFSGLSWDTIAEETRKDPVMYHIHNIISGAPKPQEPANISPYLPLRQDLQVLEGVLLYRNRVVISPCLRASVLEHFWPPFWPPGCIRNVCQGP